MSRLLFSSLILIFMLISCRKAVPELQDFDQAAWKDDKDGCVGNRSKMLPIIDREKEKLLALSEVEIVGLLGTPDQRELYSRNQKFYFYSIAPAPSCGAGTTGAKLVIRFNAMGLAKEVRIDK